MPELFRARKAQHARLARTIVFVGLFVAGAVNATIMDGDNPLELFDSARNFTVTSKVTWFPVDNIQATCNREQVHNSIGRSANSSKCNDGI